MWTPSSIPADDPMLRILGELLRGGRASGEGDAAAFVRAIRSGLHAHGVDRVSPDGGGVPVAPARLLRVPPSIHADGFPVFDDDELLRFEEIPLQRALEAYARRLADGIHMDGLHRPVELRA